MRMALDGGHYLADSLNALDRALLHTDAVYRIPNLEMSARLAQTNRLVTSALPAEGSAQGTWAMEEIIERVAEATDLSPREIREKKLLLRRAGAKDDTLRPARSGELPAPSLAPGDGER